MRTTALATLSILSLSLLPQHGVAAQEISQGGFEAPSLQKANLAFYSIFAILGLAQLSIAVSFLFRVQPSHFPPGLAGVIALIFLILSNGINVASTVARYTFDSAHRRLLSDKNVFDFEIGSDLFNNWVDPMIFLVVGVIVRDRYLAYESVGSCRAIPVVFMLIAVTFIAVLFVLPTTGTAIFDVAYTGVQEQRIPVEEFHRKVALANRLHYAYVGLGIAFVILLVWCTIVVWRHARSDKIMRSVTYVIMPLMIIHGTARLIFEVLDAVLPVSRGPSFSTHNADQLEFASNFLFHSLFFLTMCFVCRLYLRPKWWLQRRRSSSRLRERGEEAYSMSERLANGSTTGG